MVRGTAGEVGCLHYYVRTTARPQPTPGHLRLASGVYMFMSLAVPVSFLLL